MLPSKDSPVIKSGPPSYPGQAGYYTSPKKPVILFGPPSRPGQAGYVTPKKPTATPVKKTATPVKKAPVVKAAAAKPPVKVISPSSGTPVRAATSTTQASAPKVDDRWGGLSQYEVSEIMKRAKNGVGIELDPQIKGLQDQAKLYDARYAADEKNYELGTQRTVAEQKELFSRLANSLQGLQPQIAANYDENSQKVGQNYTALQQALAARYGQATSGTTSELSRLGLDAATPQATAQQGSDSKFFQSLAQSDSAQAQTSIGQSKTMAIQNLLNNMQNSAASGTRLTATTLQDALTGANERRATESDLVNSLLSKATGLESTRRGLEYENSSKLQDQLRSSKASAQQQAFDNAIASGNLDIKATLAGSDASYKAAMGSAAQTNAQAATTRANAAANEAAARAAATKAGVDYKGLELALKTSQATFAQNTKNYGTGINGAMSYLNAKAGTQPVAGAGGQSAYQIASNMFNDITNNVKSVKDLPSALADVQKRQKTNNYPQDLVNTINNALTMFYTKK